MKRCKVGNIGSFVRNRNPNLKKMIHERTISLKEVQKIFAETYKDIRTEGINVDNYGRFYANYLPSRPGPGQRWQNNRAVSRLGA